MTKNSEQKDSLQGIRGKPLIKWPGGKRTLADRIGQHFPDQFKTYYEPFFGGGALYFSTIPSKAVLSDTNADLINAYIHIRDASEALITALEKYKNTEKDYYRIRSERPDDPIKQAARFLYLTRLSFNGIYRVNLSGDFNVPYGYKDHLASVDSEQLRKTSLALRGAKLLVADFEAATSGAKAGDLIYFDPPYTVAHANNGFVKYNEKIFSWSDQERLARHARKLAAKGCRVIISNADHKSIHSLYEDFECQVILRPSVIAAAGSHRRTVSECIFVMGGQND